MEKLVTFPDDEFKAIHLEILFLEKCKARPNLKTGMALNKCSTACIKKLSKIMLQTKEWKLVETLIAHGTVPDLKCIENAIEKYDEDKALFLTQEVEKDKHNNICYDHLLSMAIDKKWHDKFVQHCLKQGGKFAPKDVWGILHWKNDPVKDILLKQMVSQDGAMDVQNQKGQIPLHFLLEQGMFTCALTLLKFKIDTSKINMIEIIKTLKKHNANKHPIITMLCEIIKNKKTSPDLLEEELTFAFRYAFNDERYEMAVVLIDYGADINSCVDDSTTIVHVATEIVLHVKGKIHILQKVLDSYKFPENGTVVDKNGQLPHHLAVTSNTLQSEAVLRLLFQYHFDLSAKNNLGETPLQCCRQNREHLKKLIEAEMNKATTITKSTTDNFKTSFQQSHTASEQDCCAVVSKQDTTMSETNTEEMPPEHEIADNSGDEITMSADELTQIVKKKVDDVLKKDDYYWREDLKSGYIQSVDSQKTANSIPSLTTENIDSEETEENWKEFEKCTWEVECTETFWKELAKQEKPLKIITFNKLFRLANGEWHEKFQKPLHTKFKNLYELKVTKSIRIIWELVITYSPRLSYQKKVESYTEAIRVWSLVLNHDHINKHVKQIEAANIKGQESAIKKNLSCIDPNKSDNVSNSRNRIPRIFKIDSHCKVSENKFFPPANTKENEYTVVSFYSFSDGFIESILKQDSRRDFPFKGWPKENEIINLSMDNSVILLGRSGTGKTTCCLYRLWNQYREYWETATDPKYPRNSLIKPKSNVDTVIEASGNETLQEGKKEVINNHLQQHCFFGEEMSYITDTCQGNIETPLETSILKLSDDMESSSETNGGSDKISSENNDKSFENVNTHKKHVVYDHLQQVFITKNSVLNAQFKKKFYDMAHTVRCLEDHLKFESMQYPCTLQKIHSHVYPLFLTFHEWLKLLDASLEDNKPFFPRNLDGSLAIKILDMDCNYDDYTETLLMLDESDSEDEEENHDHDVDTTKKFVQSHSPLIKKLWQKVDATYFCERMWRRIAKGICDVKKVNPLLVWIEIRSFIKGSSQAMQTCDGHLSVKDYIKLGHKMAPDFVGNRETAYKLFERYEEVKKRNGYFDECDVVFNLFQRLSKLNNINWCIHQFYIDEVQDFTQAELTLLLHCCRWPNGLFLTGDTAQSIMRGVSFRFSDLQSVFYYISKHVDESKGHRIIVPDLHQLTQNFRSHSGILDLAASVIDLLMNFFRSSLDELPRDQGMFVGPKPVLLLSCKFSDLALLLKGSRKEASTIEFGARQAIIVQSEKAKNYLRDKIKAIVLTVFESKGLEFDDVLLYDFFSDSKATEEWRAVVNYIDKHPEKVVNKQEIQKPRALKHFYETEHKVLNAELKFLYTAITRARCNLWIYDSDQNRSASAAVFYYFQKRGLVTVLSTPSSDLSNDKLSEDMELKFTKHSSKEEWKQQGNQFREQKNWRMAIFCYNKAGMDELVKETEAYSNIFMAKYVKMDKKQHYLKASLNFLRLSDIQPPLKWIHKAAICLFKACEYDLSALLFLKLHKVDLAVKAYVKGGQYETAANLCVKNNQTEKAIKILLLDEQGKSLPYALELVLTLKNVQLELGCSVNMIAQQTAQYYLNKNKISKALACVEYFSEFKDKVSLFKKANCIDDAVQMLYTNKQYDDLYHLLKGQECFERGAEIAEKLGHYQVHCEFLLLLVKKKLITTEYVDKKEKLKDAEILKHANDDKLGDGNRTLKLQIELVCEILKEDPLACFNVCKKFISINHFGAIEALNAAVNFRKPKLNLEKINVIVDCLQFIYDIVDSIEKNGKISSNHAPQCRKFYQFEQSEDKFFLPPHQHYWMPKLEKCCLHDRDVDGMMQFDEHKVYKVLKIHLKNISRKWLLLDLEKTLFSIMTSQKYVTLNSKLNKSLDIHNFAIKSYNMCDYLTCCIRLIEIAHYHYGKDIKGCTLEDTVSHVKILKWGTLSDYASLRIFNMFSPQWCYYFAFSDEHIKMIKKSKITCYSLFTMLHSDQVGHNVNDFLKNYCILKLTGSNASTLEKHLKNEETKFNHASKKTEDKSELKDQDKNKQFTILTDKQNDNKKTDHNQPIKNSALFIKLDDSNYSHIFFTWLQSCKCLENNDFMAFAEGIVEHLLILVAKRKPLKPKITVLNITYILEILCTGLFGSLQVADTHTNRTKSIKVLFPKFYEHSAASFDPINFTPHAFLDIVAVSVSKSKSKFKEIHTKSLHLLQTMFYLLLGKIEPSYNVLRHASSVSVSNNGFERCLVLCLSIFGNLWPLLHEAHTDRLLLNMSTVLKTTVLHSQSQIDEDNFSELFTNLQSITEIKSTEDVFNILLNIQDQYQSCLASLEYHYKTNAKGKFFSFNEIEPKQFPKFTFRPLKRVPNVQNVGQKQQHVQQLQNKRSKKSKVAQHLNLTNPAMKSTTGVQQSQKVTLPPSSDSQTCSAETTDKNLPLTISIHPLQSCNSNNENTSNEFKAAISSTQTECTTLPVLDVDFNHSEKSAEPSVFNSYDHSNQITPLIDNKQNHPDESVDLISYPAQHTEGFSALPSFQSYGNLDSTKVELPTENFHLLQQLCADDKSTGIDSTPISTGLPEPHEKVLSFTPTNNHQTRDTISSSVANIVDTDVLSQSKLNPDAEPFASGLQSDVPNNNVEQVQDLEMQVAYQQSSNYNTAYDPNLPTHNPNPLLIPYPVMPIPMIPDQLQYWYMYNPYNVMMMMTPQFYYTPEHNISTLLPKPLMDKKFEETQRDSLPSSDTEISPNTYRNLNYCLICGESFDDEQSEMNHYNSEAHDIKDKEYLAYKAIEQKYKAIFEDAKKIINFLSIGDVHSGLKAQVEKIKECNRKFDMKKKSQIEDNFEWLNGQSLVEQHAKETDLLLKEYYDLLNLRNVS